MPKQVLFDPAVKKAAKFGKRPGAGDGPGMDGQSPFAMPVVRQEIANMMGDLITLLTRFKARLENLPSDEGANVQAAQRLGLESRPVHRTVRGEMVASKSEVAIANILHALEKEGRLTYQISPEVPFAMRPAAHASFKVEANGATWFWEHCDMPDAKYKRRFEQKKELYGKAGFSVYAPDNQTGRLIVTEDSEEKGLDTQAIAQLTGTLFAN